MNKSVNSWFGDKRRVGGVIGKLKVCGIGRKQSKRRKLKKTDERNYCCTSVREGDDNVLNFYLHSESARTSVHIIVNCYV